MTRGDGTQIIPGFRPGGCALSTKLVSLSTVGAKKWPFSVTMTFESAAPVRIEGWEDRLQAVIEAARGEPYELGVHDCFRLACRVIEALTGDDRWPRFAGYRTKREALTQLAKHGSTFEDAGDWFFGCTRRPVAFARRGDVVAYRTPEDGEKHLGVCLGAEVAVMEERGLAFVKLADCLCAWSVG